MLTANVTQKVYLNQTVRAALYLRWLRGLPCWNEGSEVSYMWAKLIECTKAQKQRGMLATRRNYCHYCRAGIASDLTFCGGDDGCIGLGR